MTIGAFSSVPHRRIGLLAAIAECHSRNDLQNQLRILKKRRAHLEIIPALTELIRPDSGHLSHLKGHRSNPSNAILSGCFVQGFCQMSDNSHLVHVIFSRLLLCPCTCYSLFSLPLRLSLVKQDLKLPL